MFSKSLLNSRYRPGRIKILLLLVILFSSSTSFAQPENWDITYFSTEDGLSSNQVNYVMKDSKGFIWIGTNNGLNKFDGYTFSTLKMPTGIDHPLSRLKVLTIFEDRDSILWIGTSDGLFRYNTSEPLSDIRHFRYRNVPDSLTYRFSLPVFQICEDKNGLLWMVCYDRDDMFGYELHSFDKQSETFKVVSVDAMFYSNSGDDPSLYGWVDCIYSDRNGDLWFGSNRGLLKYNFGQDSFDLYVPFPGSQVPHINTVSCIQEDRHGNLWTGNTYGMSKFDRQSMTGEKHIPLALYPFNDYGYFSVTNAIDIDREGYLWIRVNESLARILPDKGGELETGSMEFWDPDITSLASNPMASLMVENPWIVWLGIPNRGLCRVNVRRNVFNTIRPTSLPHNRGHKLDFVNSLYTDSLDKLWISWINPGVFEFELSSAKSSFYDPIPNVWFHGIEKDQHGNMWFYSRFDYASKASLDGNGILKFKLYQSSETDPASISRRREAFAKSFGRLAQNMFEHLLIKDRHGTLWFNSGMGIHDRYNPGTDGFIHLDHRSADYFNNDSCVEAEIEGEIWFPSAEGLLRLLPPFTETDPYTLKPGACIIYKNQADDETSISADWVRCICFSSVHEPGTLWIGTIRGGMNKLVRIPIEGTNRSEVRFEHYTMEDGLCDNNVLGIIEDEEGYLWLSTLNGLSRFDPGTGIFNNFYKEDGLPSNHFSWASPFKNSSGELFFATEEGVLTFKPNEIHLNNVAPPIVMTDFRILNEAVYPGEDSPIDQDINFVKAIDLQYDQNFLSLEFAALNNESPERNQYKYMLEGFDRDWVHAGTRRFVEYKGLKPGRYTFRVQGSNNSGVWNEEGATLELNIQNPPWLRWWAYFLYVLLLTGLILWYRGILVKREKLKSAVELERLEKDKIKEIDYFRSRFFTNISHEFRTPLTLLTGPLEESVNKGGKEVLMKMRVLQVMLRSARRLQRLIGQLLDISKIESGSMQLQLSKGSMTDFVRSIASSFLSLAESNMINYNIQIDERAQDSCFDADKLEKVITNLLSNAFKFTREGGMVNINLVFTPSDGSLEQSFATLTVSDTGKGIVMDELEHIFDRFYQVSDNDTRDAEGSGIGLALTKELVELMHGEIQVDSKPGKGTLFKVTLPVNEESYGELGISNLHPLQLSPHEWENFSIGSVEPPVHVKVESDTELILVVEDNPDLREYIREQFIENYQLIEANNGKLGLEKAIEHIPDLVITDLMMPEMGGIEMCRKIKKHAATNHIPIIMLTAKADKESKLVGLEASADDYIVKPFDAQLLKARATNLIKQRKELRKKFEKSFLFDFEQEAVVSPQNRLLRDILSVYHRNLSDPGFKLEDLSSQLNLSRGQLFRKVNAVIGSTPNELLRLVRIKHAARLLRAGNLNVTQVMYQVGLQNPSYFAKSFRKYYGVNPSQYK